MQLHRVCSNLPPLGAALAFGDENGPEIAHNSSDLDETQGDEETQDDNKRGVGETLMGYGRISLVECLERMGVQPNLLPASLGKSCRAMS